MKRLTKIIIGLLIFVIVLGGIWLSLGEKTKCKLLYGKNTCNFYEMMNIPVSIDNFDKMMNLCRDMENIPKKDSCFEVIADSFINIDTEKSKQACDEIKEFNGIHKKEDCYNKIQTADWQTYRNEEYGFEVKYPEDWFVREDTFTKEIYFGETVGFYEENGTKIPVEKIGFSVEFYSNLSKLFGNESVLLSLKDWVSETFLPLQEGENVEDITFGANNYNGILVETYKELGVVHLIKTVYVKQDESIYELKGEVLTPATAGVPTKYNYDKIFNQMLSTFRFLE